MKLFEDLPSQNTPISAEMLNQIKDKLIVVSPTAPTGNDTEKVWIRVGKNYLDIANGLSEADETGKITKNGVTITRNSGGTLNLNGTCTYEFPLIILDNLSRDLYNKYSLSYKVKKGSMTGGSVRISVNNKASSSPTDANARLLSTVWATGTTSGSDTKEVSDQAKYFGIWINAGCVFSDCEISLQLEQGPATEHETYVEPRIYIKNNNNVYEKIYL